MVDHYNIKLSILQTFCSRLNKFGNNPARVRSIAMTPGPTNADIVNHYS